MESQHGNALPVGYKVISVMAYLSEWLRSDGETGSTLLERTRKGLVSLNTGFSASAMDLSLSRIPSFSVALPLVDSVPPPAESARFRLGAVGREVVAGTIAKLEGVDGNLSDFGEVSCMVRERSSGAAVLKQRLRRISTIA
jgi:hypothetical protein